MQYQDFQDILPLLCCPKNSEDLHQAGNYFKSQKSGLSYPLSGGIPWLLPAPAAALAQWRSRAVQYCNFMAEEIRDSRATIAKKNTLAGTKSRLTSWVKGRESHLKTFSNLLSEVLGAPVEGAKGVSEALWGRQPVQQQLVNYDQTIFRDWVWGEEETSKTLDLIGRVLPENREWGKTLFAGAGACGIPVRLHQKYQIELSVACDINPWLFQVAKKMTGGTELRLTEFPHPVQPGGAPSIEHCLKPPADLPRKFYLVLSDFLQAPFREEAFSSLCTPWFIDIIQKDLSVIFRIINSLLKPGGLWLNFGPLLFDHCQVGERYTFEEVLHLARKTGFEVLSHAHERLPYINSPHSAHKRTETIHAFTAKKTKSVAAPKEPGSPLPDWLTDHSLPVPLRPFFKNFGESQKVYCDIIALIDDQRSVNDLCESLAEKFRTTPENMRPSLVNFLSSLAEEQRSFLFRGLS